MWAHADAPHAEHLVHLLASNSDRDIRTSTPLTGARHRAAAKPGKSTKTQSAPPLKTAPVIRTCRECGTRISSRAVLCGPCWTATRPARSKKEGFTAAQRSLAKARSVGADPTKTPTANARRLATYSATKELDRAWEQDHGHVKRGDPAAFRKDILPGLANIRLAALAGATGLTQATCSQIRSGQRTPHPRHWDALRVLTDSEPQEQPWEPGEAKILGKLGT